MRVLLGALAIVASGHFSVRMALSAVPITAQTLCMLLQCAWLPHWQLAAAQLLPSGHLIGRLQRRVPSGSSWRSSPSADFAVAFPAAALRGRNVVSC